MKFLLTKELGRLATWLRILGFDAVYFKEDNTGSLIICALRDERVILTRNQRLPRSRGIRIILLKEEKVKAQLKETLGILKLKIPDEKSMFSRCVLCNEKLEAIEKEKIREKVPEYVYETQNEFFTCPNCQRIYWQGTHWGNVTSILKEINH